MGSGLERSGSRGWASVSPSRGSGISCLLGAAGFGYGFLTVRARKAWLLMALMALFANGTLLLLPFAFDAELQAALTAR